MTSQHRAVMPRASQVRELQQVLLQANILPKYVVIKCDRFRHGRDEYRYFFNVRR